MNRIETYFDPEVGGWMVRGTRRPNNRIFPDKTSAEKYAQRAEKARERNYRNLTLSYDDIYNTSITAADMPHSPTNGRRNGGTEAGGGFKDAFEDIWDDTSATRTLGELVDMSKHNSDVASFLTRLYRTYPYGNIHNALTTLLGYPEGD